MRNRKPAKLDFYAGAKELGIDLDDLVKRVRSNPPSSKEIQKLMNSRTYRRIITKSTREKRAIIVTYLVWNMSFRPTNPYWLFALWRVFVPCKPKLADAVLLFVCKPDDAEVAAGDLLEELNKVQSRHGKWYCNFWFFWELSLLVIVKGRKRLTKSVLGPLVDLWKRKSG